MDRRGFMKAVAGAIAVAATSPVAVAVEALAPPTIAWKCYETIGTGYINLNAVQGVLAGMQARAVADIIEKEDKEFLRCLDGVSVGVY